MKKLLLLFAVLLTTVGAWAQTGDYYRPGSRTVTLEAGKKYFISAATFYNNARPNLLFNNEGKLEYSDKKPTSLISDDAYLFTVEKVGESNVYYITNNEGKYLQSDNLSSADTETGITIVSYASVKGSMTCGNDVQACDENGNKIEYNNITSATPIVCVYKDNSKGWRHIEGLEIGKSTPFAFYEAVKALPEVTTNTSAPILYTIKNVRGNAYATYDGDGNHMKLRSDMEKGTQLFYFTAGATEGTFKIHNYATNLKCSAVNSWTQDGIDWYIQKSACATHDGLAISKAKEMTETGNEAWNDFQNKHTSIDWYGGNDAGSVWKIEKFNGANPGIEVSADNSIGNIKLHYIRSNRRDTYVNFDGHNSTFKEGEKGLNSYWYFVQDTEAQKNAPEGFIACRIFNAAHATGVENHSSGYMGDASWPARVYYIGIRENNNCGYIIRRADNENNGWHDFSGTYVGDYGLGDDGSLWRIYPAEKTATELQTEAIAQKQQTKNLLDDALSADYYTWSAQDINTAINELDLLSTDKLHEVISIIQNKVYAALNQKEKVAQGPVVGKYIQLKNRKYKTYLKDNGSGLRGVNDATGNATLWLVVKGTDDKVKIQNAETGKYIGQIRQSAGVAMVDEASAKEFAFTNQTDVYAVFKETSGGDYAHGHIDGQNVLVGWEKYADASQWIISEVSVEEALDELKAIHDVVDNAFGDQPGQYKQSMQEVDETMHTTVKGVVEPMLEDGAVVDVPTARNAIISLKAQWDGVKTTVREINAPAQGKFYRLKNVASGNYMCGNASDVKLLSDGSSVHATIFYLGDKNTLLSYNSGRYLDCSAKGYSEVGVAKTGEFAMAYGGAQANVITYKNNGYSTYGAGADGGGLDRGASDPNHIGYNWKLEEVTWLPIPVNVEAGYTTIYSPVELELSQGRFKAYTVSKVSETYATLTEQTVVPAGVGVVLEYQDGATIENGCVYLRIKGNETTGVTSELLGTYADEYIAGDAYVLSMVEGKVGLYKAKLNQQENTAFLNNGFKAYLPKPAASNSRFFVFDFGGNETGIDELEGENGNVKTEIYDLAGRRVQSAQKGVFVVNGKVVIK